MPALADEVVARALGRGRPRGERFVLEDGLAARVAIRQILFGAARKRVDGTFRATFVLEDVSLLCDRERGLGRGLLGALTWERLPLQDFAGGSDLLGVGFWRRALCFFFTETSTLASTRFFASSRALPGAISSIVA